jgi:TrmH family RNA methyltransferase
MERERRKLVLVEGFRAVEAALAADAVAELYLTVPGSRRHPGAREAAASSGVRPAEVTSEVMAAMTTLRTPPDILAIARMPAERAGDGVGGGALVLSNVRDPATAGGIMAVAAASGLSKVVATKGSVDLFDPKAVRAGLGAHFRLEVTRRAGEEETIERFRSAGARIVALIDSGGVSPWEASLTGPIALIVCGEGQSSSADVTVSAPAEGSSIGARAAMVLYERKRQTA